MDSGERARRQVRREGELLRATAKARDMIRASNELRENAKGTDFSASDMRIENTCKMTKLLREVMLKEREHGFEPFDSEKIIKLVSCAQLTVAEKKSIIDQMGFSDSGRIRILRFVDRLEEDSRNLLGVRVVEEIPFDEGQFEELSALFRQLFLAADQQETKKILKEFELKTNDTIDMEFVSQLLLAMNPNEHFIVDAKIVGAAMDKLGIEVFTNPSNYVDMDELFHSIRYELGLKDYGQVDRFLQK